MNSKIQKKSKRGGAAASRRSGTLLLIVLVTIVILSLTAYTFTSLMQNEDEASRLVTLRVQSKYLVDSGLDYTRLFLSQSNATIREKGGIWDNADTFQGIPVAISTTDPSRIGYFSVITSSLDQDSGTPEGSRFGLIDESSKINLNTLTYTDAIFPGSAREILLALPDMTEEIADSILDWLDTDDEPREFGNESAYYTGEAQPYECKNGPMDSLDELLLIRGVTAEMLFGLDLNRNGLLDPAEANTADVSVSESDMYLGWSNYLTLYSNESNLTGEGLQRINVNADDLEQLYDDLKSAFNDEWANFIIYYRCSDTDPITELPEEVEAQNAAAFPIDFSNPNLTSKRKLDSIVDLCFAYVDVAVFDDENLSGNSYVASPIQFLNMGFTIPTMMATLTTFEGLTIPGRVNLMQAPRAVLDAIPGLTDEQVDQIISQRGDDFELDSPDGADLNRKYETWLLVEGIVDLETMKSLMSFVCTGGDVYRAEITGYFPDGAGTSRAEVVLDTTVEVPRVLFWRDKSHLRSGFSLDTLGVDLLPQ